MFDASMELGLGIGELLILAETLCIGLRVLPLSLREPYVVVEPEFQVPKSFLRIVVVVRSSAAWSTAAAAQTEERGRKMATVVRTREPNSGTLV
jgi:hypothetical protein